MKRKDILIIVLFLLVAVLLLGASRLFLSSGSKESAASYLRIQVGSETYKTVPLNKEDTVTIDQGGGKKNVVQIGVNSAHMLSSTCKNQECVHQGVVSLENRNNRALFNMVVCLPNQVLLELIPADEMPEEQK